MTEKIESLKQQIDRCTTKEKRLLATHLNSLLGLHPLEAEWGIDSETILNAIQRASDLTKRGVRGIIAEAIFVNRVVPSIADSGWSFRVMNSNDLPYDALLQKGEQKARIQIKLQRLEKGIPKLYYPKQFSEELYVVDVQKTRSGKRQSKSASSSERTTESTRPTTSAISTSLPSTCTLRHMSGRDFNTPLRIG
jgi:hypothetical protein